MDSGHQEIALWIPEDEFCIPGMDSAYLEMYSGCVSDGSWVLGDGLLVI